LLDFGLAKYQEAKAFPDGSHLETRDRPLTEEGTILGTVQYMAPEQLEGKESDARTDIFALGEILYEMITGRRTFQGQSKAALISSILSSEPTAISTIQPLAPAALDHLVKKCLAKDPDERWQNAHDVASELKWISESSQSSPTVPAGKVVRRKNWERITWAVLAMILLGLTIFLYTTREPKDTSLMRLSLVPEGETRITGQLAISPDGKKVAFVAKTIDGETSLWVRSMDWLNAKELPGTSDAIYPFWAPDSRYIGFFADGKLKKIDMGEGPPQTLCEAPVGRGGSWNKDGIIIFSPNFTAQSILKVPAGGGACEPVFPGESNTTVVDPYFLPDGNHFLFRLGGSSQKKGLYVGSLNSAGLKKILDGDISRVEVADTGWILFVKENNLMASRFDLKTFEVAGNAQPIVQNISFDGAYHSFSVSGAGVLSYSNVDLINTQLVWLDRAGKQIADVGSPGQNIEPSLSPDEKKLSIGRVDSGTVRVNIWIVDLMRGTTTRLTNDSKSNHYGSTWSPDGTRIVYSCTVGGSGFDICEHSSGGTGGAKALLSMPDAQFSDDWSADGRYILFEHEDPKTKYDLWYLPLFGDRKPQPYIHSEFNEAHARFSPDGKWVAYGSDEIGRSEIYVRRFPDAGSGKWQISTGGGDQPYWRGDGKELYYLAPNGKIMAVEVNAGDTFDASVPVPLFQTFVIPQGLIGSDRNQYVVTADGQRFLVNSSPAQAIFAPITVVFNWTEMLKK
jgi:Tol biopolymer transport system component